MSSPDLNQRDEIMKIYSDFNQNNLYKIKHDSSGEYMYLVANSRLKNFFYWFGKKNLSDFKDRNLNSLIFNFVQSKLEEEKNECQKYNECKHTDLKIIYRKKIFWNYIKVSIVFYILPFLYLFNNNMKKFGMIRFVLFLPYLFSFRSFINMVNEYNLKKNSILFLFVIENIYNRDCPHHKIYSDFQEFCKLNTLVFLNEKYDKKKANGI